MGNFDRRGGSNRNKYGSKKGGSSRPTLYSATCSDCGNRCQVPFKPMGNKPVRCSDCFQGVKGSNDSSHSHGNSRRFNDKPRFQEKQMHAATCADCGNQCQVPFRPTGDKPIYCSNCFAANKEVGFEPRRLPQSKASNDGVDSINKKLDRIIVLLEKMTRREFLVEKEDKEDLEFKFSDPEKIINKTKEDDSKIEEIAKETKPKKAKAKKKTAAKKTSTPKKELKEVKPKAKKTKTMTKKKTVSKKTTEKKKTKKTIKKETKKSAKKPVKSKKE